MLSCRYEQTQNEWIFLSRFQLNNKHNRWKLCQPILKYKKVSSVVNKTLRKKTSYIYNPLKLESIFINSQFNPKAPISRAIILLLFYLRPSVWPWADRWSNQAGPGTLLTRSRPMLGIYRSHVVNLPAVFT